MVAQSVTGTPGHINPMATGMVHFLERFPIDTLKPGDVLITNDPWMTASQINDLTIATPVFKDGRAIALFANCCHALDIGGGARLFGHVVDREDLIARWRAASLQQQHLAALSARMRQVTSDMVVQKQRLHSVQSDVARQGIVEIIGVLKRQAKELSGAIAALIANDPVWAALDTVFRSVKGVADRTVATLIADLPEIGTLSNKQIAKLVGLAPLADDSGKRQGKRHTRGGRSSVRSLLFLIGDIARKYDQSMTDFRNRLLAAGNPKMVVRIALAHKLLVRLNAKARETRAAIAQQG
jgi:hypothetical protein